MKFFQYKSALDIPELKNSKIDEIIKRATSGNQLSIAPNVIYQINELGVNKVNCAIIVTNLLRVFDELGSHPVPVFRSLSILLALLKQGQRDFVPVARALVPEIETVLHLTFKDRRAPLRPRIHAIAQDIYNFLMYDSQLPDIAKYTGGDDDDVRLAEAPAGSDSSEEESDADIPFEPAAVRPRADPAPAPQVTPVAEDALDESAELIAEFNQPMAFKALSPIDGAESITDIESFIKPLDAAPVEEAKAPETPEERLKEVSTLKCITKPQFDFQIESY